MMNRQFSEGVEPELNRIESARALKLEGLEDRTLLAADFQGAMDASATIPDDSSASVDVPAEVSQADHFTADGTRLRGLELASEVSASSRVDALAADRVIADTQASNDMRLASFTIDLPNGQSYNLSLFQSAVGVFRLTVDNSTVTDQDAASASVDAASVDGSLGADVSTNVAAPMILGSMDPVLAGSSVDASMNGGFGDSSMAPSNLGSSTSVGANLDGGSDVNLNSDSDMLFADSSASSSESLDFDSSMDSGLSGEGEWSGRRGWVLTGTSTHPSSDSTPEQKSFRSRAWMLNGSHPSSESSSPQEKSFRSRA